jgi:hypothetical protein
LPVFLKLRRFLKICGVKFSDGRGVRYGRNNDEMFTAVEAFTMIGDYDLIIPKTKFNTISC